MGNREAKAKKRANKKTKERQQKAQKAQKTAAKPLRFLTDYAHAIIRQLDGFSRTKAQFEMLFHMFTQRVHRLSPSEAYQEALEHISQAIRGTNAKISCTKGCSACCHQPVDLTPVEEGIILEHVKTHRVSIDPRLLQLQTSVEARDKGIRNALEFAERRCLFLGKEGECSIYAARPLTC